MAYKSSASVLTSSSHSSFLAKGTLSFSDLPIKFDPAMFVFAINKDSGKIIAEKGNSLYPYNLTFNASSRIATLSVLAAQPDFSIGDTIEMHYSITAAKRGKSVQEYKVDYEKQVIDLVTSEDTNNQMGENGLAYCSHSDLAAKIGPFFAIQVIEECTFTAGTTVADGHEQPPQNWTFPAGTMIYGLFTAIRCATGKVIGYRTGREISSKFDYISS